jgi:hypothetical protein
MQHAEEPDAKSDTIDTPETLAEYAVTISTAFDHVRKMALEVAEKHATTDPDTSQLYRSWADNLEDAKSVWRDLEGPSSPDRTTMIERAVDATIITEANAPPGADKDAEGGLVMQWLSVLKKVDPGALRRKPRTSEAFARRISLELMMPDNLDRKDPASMDQLNAIAAEVAFMGNDTAYPNLATGIRYLGHLALSELNAMGASASAATVSSLVLACTPKEKPPKPPKPVRAPALYRPRPTATPMRAPPRASPKPKVRLRTDDLHARPRGRVRLDDDDDSPLNRAGVAIIEGLAAVDASVDAVQAFHRRFVETQTKFRRPDGAVDWGSLLIAVRNAR